MLRIAIACLGLLATVLASWLLPRIDSPPTRFEIARQLLDSGRPEDALLLFEEPLWRGIAEYRAGRYTRAVGEFFPAQSILELYNLGTAYAQLEEWSGAISALEKVVRLDPEHADAIHNLEIALRASELEARLAVKTDATPQLENASGDRQQRAQMERGDPSQARSSGSQESESSASDGQVGETGDGVKPGQLGNRENSLEPGTVAATGTVDDRTEPPSEQEPAGSTRLQARESAQAAEILFRQIRDDPERVLRARLFAAHQARQPSEP